MSTDAGIENGQQEQVQQTPSEIKNLRKAAEENPILKAEKAALARENAFLKAGINTDDPKLAYFYKGYDGEMTPEAIKQAAITAGFLSAPAADPQQQAALQSQQNISAVGNAQGMAPGASAGDMLAAQEKAYAEGGVQGLADHMASLGFRVAEQ
jgi:ribosomal protein L12E/L44/L45/RPP1/RPP2